MRVSSIFAYFFKPPCQQLLKSGWQPSIHAGFKDFSIFFKIFSNSYAKVAGNPVFMRVLGIFADIFK
jgi:hypothetical protein